jgi:hypothetical protein
MCDKNGYTVFSGKIWPHLYSLDIGVNTTDMLYNI